MGRNDVVDRFYIALFSALEQNHCARMRFYMNDKIKKSAFLNIHPSGVLTALTWLVPHETATVFVYAIQPCACHFMQSHIYKVHACLAVTCHLYLWQNYRDLLRATAVTRGETDAEIRVSIEVDLGEANSPAAPAGTRTRDLSVMSPAV